MVGVGLSDFLECLAKVQRDISRHALRRSDRVRAEAKAAAFFEAAAIARKYTLDALSGVR